MIQRAWAIYRDNASTFYDFRTNDKQSRWMQLFLPPVIAAAAVFLVPIESLDILSATITVQAILIGFSFSVMFFLVQNCSPPHRELTIESSPSREPSLENQLDEEQVQLLSKELFWNISYFNLVAFASLVAAIFLMMPNIWSGFDRVLPDLVEIGGQKPNYQLLARSSSYIGQWVFALLIIESGYTFVRTVGRVNFLFEQRMGLKA